jgi:hypothetical protein
MFICLLYLLSACPLPPLYFFSAVRPPPTADLMPFSSPSVHYIFASFSPLSLVLGLLSDFEPTPSAALAVTITTPGLRPPPIIQWN